jgi:hypothetical protein
MPPVTPPAPCTRTVCPARTCSAPSITYLVSGERRDRQRRSGVDGHSRRQDGHLCGGGDVPSGPGALVAQRRRMHGDPVARGDSRNAVSDRGDKPGRLDAERHRRPDTQVPPPGAGELVPVAHSAGLHVDQHLIRPQLPRPGQLQDFHWAAEPAHTPT